MHESGLRQGPLATWQPWSFHPRLTKNWISQSKNEKTFPVEEAVRAQKALRELAGLGPEMFPIQAFVGMISGGVYALRRQGRCDEEIAHAITASSSIAIKADQIGQYYAPPEERLQHRE